MSMCWYINCRLNPPELIFHLSLQFLPFSSLTVLGTLAVQIERDPKTGNTTITSVTPVSTADGAPTTTTLFDDGRKSIHAVGAQGNQPSTEELGQILRVIDGIGMEMVLDNVTVVPSSAEAKLEQRGSNSNMQAFAFSYPNLMASSGEGLKQADSCTSDKFDSKMSRVSGASGTDNKADKKEDRSIVTVEDIARETGQAQVESLEHEPVTLVFMGYADSVNDKGHDDEVEECMLTAERVMITDDGEEYVLGQETLPNTEKDAKTPVSAENGVEENGAAHVKVQGGEVEKVPSEPASQKKEKQMPDARPDGTSKCKKCQCCVVM